MSQQAVILAGGKGSRLGAVTARRPKPLLRVAGRPFVEHLLERLRRFGFDEAILLVGPFADAYRDVLGDGARFGLDLHFVPEPEPRGTGGALHEAAGLLDERFLLLNGDSFFDVDYRDLIARVPDRPWVGCIALRAVGDAGRYGRVVVEPDGDAGGDSGRDADRIVSFAEKAEPGAGVINAGLYWLRRSILDHVPVSVVSLEQEVLPGLARDGLLYGHVYDGRFIDIGTPEDLARAEAVMQAAT